jgi:hypothetical protein
MTAQIVHQPAVEREKPATNGSAAPTPSSAKAPQTEAPARSKRPRVIVAGGLLVAGLAGFGLWHFFFAGPSVEPGVIAVSGRISDRSASACLAPPRCGSLRGTLLALTRQSFGDPRSELLVVLGRDAERPGKRRKSGVRSRDHRSWTQRHGVTLRSQGFSCQRARKDTFEVNA